MVTIRTFIAIHLTEEVRRGIGRAIEVLKPHTRDIRWVPLENLHLTLRFLGDVEEGRMPEVHQAVMAAAAEMMPFALRLGHFGAFPGLSRPRVLWIGMEGDVEALRELQQQVSEALVRRGFPDEDKPFSPHLTVGRTMRDRRASVQASPTVAEPGPEMVVRDVFVMKSDLHPDGPVYTSLFKVALKM